MKKVRFAIPTAAGVETREGYRIRVRLAANLSPTTFVLQLSEYGRPSVLAHYASGMRLTDLTGAMVRRYVANPYAYDSRLSTWRAEAARYIAQLVRSHGLTAVREKLNAAPVLNR